MSRIRAARERRGWTQGDLAERAAVTRQLVSAIESGRHVPNVAAAVRLAKALSLTVEQLFADTDPRPITRDVRGSALAHGTPVITVRVGERITATPIDVVATSEQWWIADAVTDADALRTLSGGSHDGVLVAGCDPLLGLLAGLTMRRSGDRVVAVHASSATAIAALAAGRVHGVVVHGPAGHLPTPPCDVERWHVAQWQVGLAGAKAHLLVDELLTTNARVAQREPGAASQAAWERAIQQRGFVGTTPGPIARGHVDAARRVADGGADAGITIEAAAHMFSLVFEPLEVHDVEIWVDNTWRNLPAMRAFIDRFDDVALREQGDLLAGYDFTACGRRVA